MVNTLVVPGLGMEAEVGGGGNYAFKDQHSVLVTSNAKHILNYFFWLHRSGKKHPNI